VGSRLQRDQGGGSVGRRRLVSATVTHICDRCGRAILEGETRYVAKVEIYAAADRLIVSGEDLKADTIAAYEALLRKCEGMTEEELMRDVHVAFRFDLCRRCQRAYVMNPLGGE
jgi:hypothetical protein